LIFSILELASFERARLECLSLKNCKSKSIYFFSTFFSEEVIKFFILMRGLKIPVVDMSSPHARLVQEWGSAFRTFGFCKIVNHGMKSNLLEDAARRFFMQSLEEKMTAASPFYGENGYSKVGVESVGQKEPDPVESLVFNKGKARCSAVTVADELAWRYYGDCEELTRLLMRITAESMGWPSSFFDKAYERPSCALRLARYDSKKDSSKKEFLYAEHTDYTGFTLLKADPVAGLEV
jgi:isopenicillin N synthase-like dioxygenase